MGIAEGVAHLGEDRLYHGDGKRADVADHRVESPSLYVLHDEVQDVLAFLDGVDGNDVGMAQRRGSARLPFEALDHALPHEQQGRRQHLDRHLAVEGEIVGEVHGGHPPTPQLGEDLVLAERCFAQGIELGVVLGGQWTAHGRRDRGARAARSQRDAGAAAQTEIRPRRQGGAAARAISFGLGSHQGLSGSPLSNNTWAPGGQLVAGKAVSDPSRKQGSTAGRP